MFLSEYLPRYTIAEKHEKCGQKDPARMWQWEQTNSLHMVPKSEVQKCWRLAPGYDDIVILLTRPSKDHQYNVVFDKFVLRSPVLKAIKDLVRFASGGARSIIDVCILDVFSFKPKQLNTRRHYPSDLECHDLIERMIKSKGHE